MVLVQQHDVQARTDVCDGVGKLVDDALSEPDLIDVLPQIVGGLIGAPPLDEHGQHHSILRLLGNLSSFSTPGTEHIELRDERAIVFDNPVRLDGEFTQLTIEAEHEIGDIHRAATHTSQTLTHLVAMKCTHHPVGVLVPKTVGQQRGFRLVSDAQSVVRHHPRGERVVGED